MMSVLVMSMRKFCDISEQSAVTCVNIVSTVLKFHFYLDVSQRIVLNMKYDAVIGPRGGFCNNIVQDLLCCTSECRQSALRVTLKIYSDTALKVRLDK